MTNITMDSAPVEYDDLCEHFEDVLEFKLIKDPTYRHHASGPLYNAQRYRCYAKKVKDGYIHLAVALSRVTDSEGKGRVTIACTLAEDDIIYGVRGFYKTVFPYDSVPIAMVWLKDATHNFTKVSSNINFVAGRFYSNNRQRSKAKSRAFLKMFWFRFKSFVTMS